MRIHESWGGEFVSIPVGRKRRFGYWIGKRHADPRRARYKELEKEIVNAETVETIESLERTVTNERGFLGEKAHGDLHLLAAKRLNKLGKKKKSLKLGPAGEVGIESQGKF
jgi:hypothetical protein